MQFPLFCANFSEFVMLLTVYGRFGGSREGILKPYGSFSLNYKRINDMVLPPFLY